MQEADPDTDCDGDGVDEDAAMAELEPEPPVVVDRARTSSLLLPVADEPPVVAVGRAVLPPTATDRAIPVLSESVVKWPPAEAPLLAFSGVPAILPALVNDPVPTKADVVMPVTPVVLVSAADDPIPPVPTPAPPPPALNVAVVAVVPF
uniref:Uncharacterized protein n=1 Tax=Anopheles merus TaxID=30066 RepID=A0A182VPG3_ANOME